MMLFNTDGKTLNTHLRTLHVLVFLLLLTHSCRGSSQPIVATLGDDIILPCHLVPAEDATDLTLEWTRPDLNPRFVHVWRSGQELVSKKHKSFEGRTSLFLDELKSGNISLKLSKVKIADQGRYRCFIPGLDQQSFVELVVGAACSPVFTLAGIDEATRGVMLDCRSEGWYPEPEVLWLDGEGNLLSAGPPETVRGPDDLYTVSSRVTVEKRHNNSFTCRVQQKNTNQTRETHFSISNDFFNVQSSSVPVITGLAVSLAVWIILFILLLLFVVWKWRPNRISYGVYKKCDETKRSCRDQTDEGEKKNGSEINKSEDQCVTEEREREQLMTHETVQMEVLKGNEQKESKHSKKKRSEQQLQEEQRRREEAEKEVQTLKEELQTLKNEIETKGAELQQLHEEKKRNEKELQSLKEELEKKSQEMERIQNTQSSSSSSSPLKDKQQAAEAQMKKTNEDLKRQLKMKDDSISQLMRELSDEKQKKEEAEKDLEELKTKLEDKEKAADARWKKTNEEWKKNNEEMNETKLQLKNKKEEISQLKGELHDEKQKKEEAERELKELMTKNTELQQKLHEEKTKREEAEKEEENLKKEMEDKRKEESSSANQSSATGLLIDVQVNQQDRCIRLKNKSNQDQPLGGWRLETQVNRKIISYRFEKSFKLKSGSTVSMSGPDCVQRCDLHWKDLTPWNSEDNLKFTLISNTDVRYQLNSY